MWFDSQQPFVGRSVGWRHSKRPCSRLAIDRKTRKLFTIHGALNTRPNTSTIYCRGRKVDVGLCHHGTVEFESICSAESGNAAKSFVPRFEA